jgi:8-oxo-dGTP pyrophosphatase MutT (NUDIX family)
MPWDVEKRGNQWCVVKTDDGEVEGCHDSQAHARDQQKALYAAEGRPEAVTAAIPAGEVTPYPLAAGVALVAADTGRVLMIQRAMIDGELACGKWEFPGGGLDDGEDPWDGAAREFGEEVGHPLPDGHPVATWLSSDGVYRGYVYLTPAEDGIAILERHDDGRAVDDPDNPGQSNYTEAVAWFDPYDLDRGPRILREECRSMDWKLLKGHGGSMVASTSVPVTIDADKLAAAIRSAIHVGVVREDAPNRDLDSLVASLTASVAQMVPEEPLPGPTPITLGDDGAYDGHLALWASCHIGYPGCVTPPREESFDFYNLGDAVTADGRHVPVGKFTIGCGHAGEDLSWMGAQAHYDNSGTAIGVSHATPDRWGIRLPGAIVADASGAQIDEFRRSPGSGDWRKISGRLRLVAALGVNVPGFAVPRAMVAGGEVQSMFVGFDLQDAAAAQTEADEIAESLGLTPAQRADAIRASILK